MGNIDYPLSSQLGQAVTCVCAPVGVWEATEEQVGLLQQEEHVLGRTCHDVKPNWNQ